MKPKILLLTIVILSIIPIAFAEKCTEDNYEKCDIKKVKPSDLNIRKVFEEDRAKELTSAQIKEHINKIGNLMLADENEVIKALGELGVAITTLKDTDTLSFKDGVLSTGSLFGSTVHVKNEFHSKGTFSIVNGAITFKPNRVPPTTKVVYDPKIGGKKVVLNRIEIPHGSGDTYHLDLGDSLALYKGDKIGGSFSLVNDDILVLKGNKLTVNEIEIEDVKASFILCRDSCSPEVVAGKNYVWLKKTGIQGQGRYSMRFTDLGYFDVLGSKEGYRYRKENDYMKIIVGNSERSGTIDIKTGHNIIPEVNSDGFVRVISDNSIFTIEDGKIVRDSIFSNGRKRGSVPVTMIGTTEDNPRPVALVVGEEKRKKPRTFSLAKYNEMNQLREGTSFKLRGYFHETVLEVFKESSDKWRDNHGFDLSNLAMRDQEGNIHYVTIIEAARTSDGRGAEAPTGWPTDIFWFIKWMTPTGTGQGEYDTSVGSIFSEQSATHEIFHTISQLDSRRSGRMDSGPLHRAFSEAARSGAASQAPTSYGSDREEWLAGVGAALVHDPKKWSKQRSAQVLLDHLKKYKDGKLPMPIIDRSTGYFFTEEDFQRYEQGSDSIPQQRIITSEEPTREPARERSSDNDGFNDPFNVDGS